MLLVEQKVVLTTDPNVGRTAGIGALAVYKSLPNYRNNWLRLGFTDEEIDSGAPRFIDAVVAWGTADQIKARVQEHMDAGANHVCIQPLNPANPMTVDMEALEALSPNG